MKNLVLGFCAMAVFNAIAGLARITVFVQDAVTGEPVEGAGVYGAFHNKKKLRWEGALSGEDDYGKTDARGFCHLKGRMNSNEVSYGIDDEEENIPQGYYRPIEGFGFHYKDTNLLGIWQPDNVVVTIALQRVENPVPLFVKKVELGKKRLEGFDGTNVVVSFDMMMGEWLPPHGKGKVADLTINSKLTITGRDRSECYPMPLPVVFFELANILTMPGRGNGLNVKYPNRKDGILIRTVTDDEFKSSMSFVQGKKKVESRVNDGERHSSYFDDYDENRCYVFRIRSKYNEKGELIDGYYGKIYGDFKLLGGDPNGLMGVRFRYYLNPRSLDRNLETDREHNLCTDPKDKMGPGSLL